MLQISIQYLASSERILFMKKKKVQDVFFFFLFPKAYWMGSNWLLYVKRIIGKAFNEANDYWSLIMDRRSLMVKFSKIWKLFPTRQTKHFTIKAILLKTMWREITRIQKNKQKIQTLLYQHNNSTVKTFGVYELESFEFKCI